MSQVLGKYHVFENDTYINLMPQLRSAGLVPLSVSDVMRVRLEAIKSCPEQEDFWLDNYFDTSDGVAYHDGIIKIVCDAQPLKDIQPDTELSYGALILTPQEYVDLDGERFSRSDLEKAGLNTRLKISEVKAHPVWQALAHDQNLLSEYADAIFREIKIRYSEERAMSVWLGSEQKQPILRAWFVDNLDPWSGVSGDCSLSSDARLVGVHAGGAAQKEGLDEIVEGL